MNKKPVQCMLLCLVFALPCIAFAYQAEQLKVKVTVKGGCTTTGNDEAHFGEHVSGNAHGAIPATGEVRYWCSAGTTHTIVADNGQNFSGGTRNMKLASGAVTIPYTWAHTPESDTGQGPANPAKVDVNVELAADALASVPPGEYEDTVTVTITP